MVVAAVVVAADAVSKEEELHIPEGSRGSENEIVLDV